MCVRACVLVLMFISKETLNYSERMKQVQLPRKRDDTSQDRPKKQNNHKCVRQRNTRQLAAEKRSQEGEKERWEGNREGKRGMKNEALK